MPGRLHPNTEMLELAASRLGRLADQMVFLGGCILGLLTDSPGRIPLRVTEDIDATIEVASLVEYHRFAQGLREAGLAEDRSPDAPICRWRADALIIDVMPTDESIIGFGNRWFEDGFKKASYHALPSGRAIRILPAPYFLATKFEAFDGRGGGDYLLSEDMEDILIILDGRNNIVKEIADNDSRSLKTYLAAQMARLIGDPHFLDVLPGFFPSDRNSQDRLPDLVRKMREIANISNF